MPITRDKAIRLVFLLLLLTAGVFQALSFHRTEAMHRHGPAFVLALAATLLALAGWLLLVRRDSWGLHRAESALRRMEAVFHSAFDHAPIGMALVAPDGRWLQVNRALCAILGYRPEEMLALTFQQVTHPDDLGGDVELARKVLAGELNSCQLDKRYIRKDGQAVWVTLSVSLVRDAGGTPLSFIAQIQDITERRSMEERLRHESTHDRLTGLPNRARFGESLARAVERCRRQPDCRYAVLFMDLDRFKVINDSLGHAAGDRLLLHVANVLHRCTRSTDRVARPGEGCTVARLGGDEFTILLEDLRIDEDAARVAERILRELSRPVNFNGHEIHPSASIGIVNGSARYQSARDVLRDADAAMYRAKALGKSRYAMFDATMHEAAIARLQLEADLRHAVQRDELELLYQPIICLHTRRVLGFEALLRWNRNGAPMMPAEFMPVAEDTGLIVPIGRWALSMACRQLAAWERERPEAGDLSIHVNLSSRQLLDGDLTHDLKRILREAQLPASRLKLEITEGLIVSDRESSLRILSGIREMGIELYMDDFGTGYSSMSCLHEFPLAGLKIDGKVIRGVAGNRDYAAVIQAMVSLARNLKMQVVAEGLESAEQVALLQALECDCGQGHYFGAPLPAGQVGHWLTSAPPSPQAA